MNCFWLLSVIFVVILVGSVDYADAARSTRVRGGVSKTGVYRQPHYRTSPDKTRINNYGTKGNINPYTGKKGTKKAYR